jgi:hypothetical protein
MVRKRYSDEDITKLITRGLINGSASNGYSIITNADYFNDLDDKSSE